MFNPLENLAGLLGMFLDIVGTTATAFLTPLVQLIVYPIAAVLGWLA